MDKAGIQNLNGCSSIYNPLHVWLDTTEQKSVNDVNLQLDHMQI